MRFFCVGGGLLVLIELPWTFRSFKCVVGFGVLGSLLLSVVVGPSVVVWFDVLIMFSCRARCWVRCCEKPAL